MMNGRQIKGKVLPARPSQDLGYNGQGGYGGVQNGYGNENVSPTGYGPRQNGRQGSSQDLNGRVLLDGYGKGGFEEERPLYNPSNTTRPQSSTLLNVNDPIQVHLLVETALGDSKEYELLSQEEVDDLKKQCHTLTQRIEQTRQNLAIQSKYRDAASSMARLYLHADKKRSISSQDSRGGTRNLFGPGGNEQPHEAEKERLASERKCEDLAMELFTLEKRFMGSQTRLLRHTAGILQMTHKGPKKVPKAQGNNQQGMPGSPESMYTYTNGRASLEPISDEFLFDERSLYRAADRLDGFGEFGGPVESMPPPPPSKAPSREQMQIISKTEQKLEDLNNRLREVVVKVNPERGETHGPPPLSKSKGVLSGDYLQGHLEYLERSISTIDRDHQQVSTRGADPAQLEETSSRLEEISHQLEESSQREEDLARRLEESEAAMEETLGDLNHDVRDILLPFNPTLPEPPQLTGQGVDGQLAYFQDNIKAMESELSRAANASSKNAGTSENFERMETVMMGLWDIIKSGEEESRQAKLERRKTRSAQNLPEDPDMSPDEDGDPNEPFSLQGFSAKVQVLYAQATKLKDQKQVLQRQIKQQRELNSKSDAQKDAEMSQKEEELQRTQDLLTRTEADSDNVREQLSVLMEKLDQLNQQEALRDQQRAGDESAAVREAQVELDNRQKTINELEEQLEDLRDDQSIAKAELEGKISDSNAKITTLNAELAAAVAAQATFQTQVQDKDKEIKEKEKEMDEMNMKLAGLQTEVTIARAELDGAYGSRAQRAAEVAANPAIQKEIDDLTKSNASLAAEIASLKSKPTIDPTMEQNMQMLKKELEETIGEYEIMTKQSIEWEKERENLEGMIDKLREERERLEGELGDEKVKWLGMRSPSGDGSQTPGGMGAGSTSTTVLKNEFKKMMRDTRNESAKILRAEQAERRRLEDELRALKRAQGPGKSGLSQSIS